MLKNYLKKQECGGIKMKNRKIDVKESEVIEDTNSNYVIRLFLDKKQSMKELATDLVTALKEEYPKKEYSKPSIIDTIEGSVIWSHPFSNVQINLNYDETKNTAEIQATSDEGRLFLRKYHERLFPERYKTLEYESKSDNDPNSHIYSIFETDNTKEKSVRLTKVNKNTGKILEERF
ncbi:hypothetical protein J4225_01925 [Candidatus Pacearchaeota archaeon]|nr:hypothetical protein [Candidatus Pacearchaeota archaeon]